jgi:hypothetical protein
MSKARAGDIVIEAYDAGKAEGVVAAAGLKIRGRRRAGRVFTITIVASPPSVGGARYWSDTLAYDLRRAGVTAVIRGGGKRLYT